jgi:hypothetical protein
MAVVIIAKQPGRVARWSFLKANAIYLYIGLLWGVGSRHNT